MPSKWPITFRTTFSTYEAYKVVGQGGCGIVYAAKVEGSTDVAIKLFDQSKATSERLKRFKNEYEFCARAVQPNIIRVTDRGLHDDEAPFIVMPLYDGSLRELMKSTLYFRSSNVDICQDNVRR